jgi:hypothetical protein
MTLTMRSGFVAGLAVVLFTTWADAAMLCARKRAHGKHGSSVRIREACRAREVRVDLTLLGPQEPAGTLVVKDVNGATVGDAFGRVDGEGATVSRRLDGTLVNLRVDANGFRGDALPSTLHESSDCTGQPLMQTDQKIPGLASTAFVRGTTAHYRKGHAFHLAVASALEYVSQASECVPKCVVCGFVCGPSGMICGDAPSFIPPNGCCYTWKPALTLLVTPLATFDLTTLGLVPPFHVEGP